MPPRNLWKPALTIIVLVGLLVIAREFQVTRSALTLIESWKDNPAAPVLFLLIGIPYSLFGLPRQALCLAAGLVFGAVVGFALSTIASLTGALLGFMWMRRLASPQTRGRWSARFSGRL